MRASSQGCNIRARGRDQLMDVGFMRGFAYKLPGSVLINMLDAAVSARTCEGQEE